MLRRRILWSIVVLISVAIAWTGVVDETAEVYAEDAFTRALVTFAVARTLNGVISLAQGTELALEPGGVGVNLGVGELLDPINDLIEQFSSVMLVAATSLGAQNVLLGITSWWGITAALAVAGLFALVVLWWPRPVTNHWIMLATRMLVLALLLRFVVPALIIGTNIIANEFLEPEQRSATAALEATAEEIEEFNEETAPLAPDASFMDRLSDTMRNTLNAMDVEGRLDRLRDSVSNASENIVNLIVLFVLQTIVLPMVFVWLILELVKGMIARTTTLGGPTRHVDS
ncbi:MAG: hypothetical protein P8X98_04450 [Woeseiaceae bacterium]|jgi:hypothetical protein